jgi:AcrR family transcriptional regulator
MTSRSYELDVFMPKDTFFNLPDTKRQRLLKCAIDEFADHDYESASVSNIVIKASISKGSLYQYFSDKNDLYHYLLELAAQKKGEILSHSFPTESNADIFQTLHQLFMKLADFEVRFPELARIGYRALNGSSPLPEDIISKGKQSTRDYFIQLIEAGKKNGSIRSDIDASAASYLITAALTELGSYLMMPETTHIGSLNSSQLSPEIEPIYHQIVSILQFGMANQSSL